MQARPGCMSGDSLFPAVQVLPLVQTGGPSNGPFPGAVQSPRGMPAVTQAWNVAISAAVTDDAGGGGICAVVFRMRSRQRRAVATPLRSATRSSYDVRCIGAPPASVVP